MRNRPILIGILLLVGIAAAITVVALRSGGDSESLVQAADDPAAPAATTTSPPDGAAATTTTSAPPTTPTTPTTSTTTTTASRATSTTTTTRPATTTTTTRPRATSTTARPNTPPTVVVAAPGRLSRHVATYDAASGKFVALVPLQASVTDPEGDSFTIEWYSSVDGFLGSGTSITAVLSPVGDASQPVITARVRDATGALTEASTQIVVWIPSDQ